MHDGPAQVAATSTPAHTAQLGDPSEAEMKETHPQTPLQLGKHSLSWTELFRKITPPLFHHSHSVVQHNWKMVTRP